MFSFQQHIDADIGRVIAKVSSRTKSTVPTEDVEKKKEKKKDKRQSHEESTSPTDNIPQNPPEGTSNVEERKEKKKKKKSKKTHSSSNTTVLGDSNSGKPTDLPQGATHEANKNPSQEKTSGPNNESSNSCLQPTSTKVFLQTFLHL
jgi:hypothetical protein